MKTGKRILSLLLALALCVSFLPLGTVPAAAGEPEESIVTGSLPADGTSQVDGADREKAEKPTETEYPVTKPSDDEPLQEGKTYSFVRVNPVYRGILSEEALLSASAAGEEPDASVQATPQAFTTVAKAGAYMRSCMKAHTAEFTFIVQDGRTISTSSELSALFDEVEDSAFAHTGVSNEGDYIRWNIMGYYSGTGSSYSSVGATITVKPFYLMTAAQDQKTETAFQTQRGKWNLSSATPYVKIKTVYDWVASTILYDRGHLAQYGDHPEQYPLMFSSYGGMIDHTCVCQGYSLIMYHFLLDLGVDCRIVTSTDHAWNIVKLGSCWYNIDSTWESNYWEAGSTGYHFFLCCPDHFENHPREYPYNTAEFERDHPMSATCYEPDAALKITQQPQSVTGAVMTFATFTLKAEGNGIGYTWQMKAPGGSWTSCKDDEAGTVIGSRTATLRVKIAEGMDGTTFRCKLKDEKGTTVTSQTAKLTVSSDIPVTVIDIPGYGLIVGGNTPTQTFAFDAYSDYYAARGLRIAEWSVYCDSEYYYLSESSTFSAGSYYSVCVKLEAMKGYAIGMPCTVGFCGMVSVDTDYSGINWDGSGATIWSVPAKASGRMSELSFSHSCTMNECLELNYYVDQSALSSYSNVALAVRYELFDGSVRYLSRAEVIYPTSATVSGTEKYRFSFKGIAAAEIGSKIYAQVMATSNGTVYCSKTDEYSIADYCYAVLARSGAKASLKTLCVDTLNYGAAAQKHFNVNPGNLCNAKLTSAQKKLSVGNVTLKPCNSTKAFSGTVKATFGGKSYVLNNAPELKLRIVPNKGVDASKLSVAFTYKRVDGTTANEKRIPEKDGSDWVVRLNTVAGPDLRQAITICVYEGSTQVSDKLTFSAEGYCCAMLQSASASASLKALCQAMMNYSAAAKAHFAS